jgi:hypothetical protein
VDVGREGQLDDKVAACLRTLLTAYAVLNKYQLVAGVPMLTMSVREAGVPNSYLFRDKVELASTARSEAARAGRSTPYWNWSLAA